MEFIDTDEECKIKTTALEEENDETSVFKRPRSNSLMNSSDSASSHQKQFINRFTTHPCSDNTIGSEEKAPLQPLNAHRLAVRQKQIDFGKNTLGYDEYVKLVLKSKRKKNDPQTPNIYQKCSRRSWDGQIKKWRKLLHKYDPPEANSKGNPEMALNLNSDIIVDQELELEKKLMKDIFDDQEWDMESEDDTDSEPMNDNPFLLKKLKTDNHIIEHLS